MNFSLRPVFIGWITLLTQLPLQLFITIWCGGFFGGMMISTGIFSKDPWIPFIFFSGLGFIGVPAVAYFGKKLNYARTEYKFYDDRLEFEEGFFTINKKVVKYKDIKELTLRMGIFQRKYGLGTIYIATLATGSSGSRTNVFSAFGFGNVSASGMGVLDIRDPEQAYEKIKTIIDQHNV